MWETPSYTLIVLLICLMKAGEIRAQCVRPIIGENRILTETSRQDNFPDGSTLTYKCSTGYVPAQPGSSNSITCKGNQWTELQLQCKLKSCGSPGDIQHGKYLTPNGIDFGATITAQCDEGYMLVGESTRNCQAEGWDGRDPVCEAVKCKPPPSIQNGNFDPIDEVYNYNQAVTYSCEKDYNLIGESTISCSDKGSFPPPPRCLKDKIGPGPIPVTDAPPHDQGKLTVGAKVGIGFGVVGGIGLLAFILFYLKKRNGFGKVPTSNEESS
ncbi:complement decay-accelerating factor-like isoform X3 [Tachysurus vachellii]|uniref:complement decay-accelerating factor-like isoform X3 n=1 Tax=Tachysurus vachellii TaxID=175792 RepID=UPI00296B0FF6|nr:complement decay-accelerating factor-like isoform X3 [Tachysurus vachellii]